MCVVSVSNYDIVVVFNETRFVYKVSRPYQAAKIIKHMPDSQGFNWLKKYGTFVTTYQ